MWLRSAVSLVRGRTVIGVRLMSSVPVPPALLQPLKVPSRLLLGPGPSNPPPEVTAAMTLPVLGYLHKEFLEVMDECRVGLQYLFQTRNAVTLAISGTGHAGMEASLMNLVEPGDKVLIAENGLWGSRAFEMATRLGGNVTKIVKPPGEAFSLGEFEQALDRERPQLLFVCHGESSTGVLQPLEGLGQACRNRDCLLLVDTVASLGGVDGIETDRMGIDAIYSGCQKVLGVPPGLAPLSFGERAMAKYWSRKTKPYSFYLDIGLIANYWGCFDEPRRYHHTAPITLVYALREGIARVAREGLESSALRHKENARRLYAGLEAMGLQLFVTNELWRLPTLTTVSVPDGVDWKKVVDRLMGGRESIELAGGLGSTAGKIWRIGLFGYNSSAANVDKLLAALKEAIGAVKSS